MRKGRGRLWIGGILVIVVLGLFLLWLRLPREHLLLEKSVRSISLLQPIPTGLPPVYRLGQFSTAIYPIFWIDARSAIRFRVKSVTPNIPEGYEAEQYDADSRDWKPLQTLNTKFFSLIREMTWTQAQGHSGEQPPVLFLFDGGLSPDGRKFLWFSCSTAGKIRSFSLDGSQAASIQISMVNPRPGYRQFAWMPDEHGWVYLDSNRLCVHLLEGSPHTLRFPLSTGHRDRFLVGVTDHNTVLTSNDQRIYETDLNGAFVEREIPVPKIVREGLLEADIILSPDGKRLAFMTVPSFQTPPGPDFVQPIWKLFGVAPQSDIRLWTYDLQQRSLHEIGGMSVRQGIVAPDHLDWTSDGKYISFMYRNTSYLVSAH